VLFGGINLDFGSINICSIWNICYLVILTSILCGRYGAYKFEKYIYISIFGF
jgi:hypothetical protein